MKKITVNDLAKVKSSNINMIGFGDDKLYVQFNNGGMYEYQGATLVDYEEFKKAESVGKHFHSHIKNNYDFNKLEEGTALQVEKEDDSQLQLEVNRLKKENAELHQALHIKQARINELEDELLAHKPIIT